jgi:hypothetical protein
LGCRSCGWAALRCGSSSKFQPTSQPLRPFTASASKSLTRTAVRVRLKQNRLVESCLQSERSGCGSRLLPSFLFGYSLTSLSDWCAGLVAARKECLAAPPYDPQSRKKSFLGPVLWGQQPRKKITRQAPTPEKSQSGLARLLSVNECGEDIRVSTPALIKMLIICAVMLTLQLLVYFAYQPVWPH